MKRLTLFLIARSAPRSDREWIVGDTFERFDEILSSQGTAAAERWLRREAWRVMLDRIGRTRLKPRTTRGAVPFIWQDVRYALRLLKRSPGFTAIAVATLALGIGANTAMFAVVNAVLLKPLPFSEPGRLMLVHMLVPDREAGPGVFREGVWSYPKYQFFLNAQQVFEEGALFSLRDLSLSGDDSPERVRGEVVTERYPAVLGVHPMRGRPFTYDEANRKGGPAVTMIGHGLWTRRYGGDPAVIGRTIQVNAVPYTVVGILPRGFRGLNGNADLWIPLAALEPSQLTQRYSHSYGLIARRKPDMSEQAAIAAVRVVGDQVAEEFGIGDELAKNEPRWGASAASLYASRADSDIRRASLVLLGAVGFVLLIACVNLTNLLVAKTIARRREVAIRAALGASRGRIGWQFLVESVVLAGFGAIGGVAVAVLLLSAAAMLLPDSDVFFRTSVAPGAPRIAGAAGLTRIGASMIGLDGMTLLFTCAVAFVTAGLVALVPASQASSLRPIDALKAAGTAGAARGRHGFGVRATLVMTQIALALVLLAGAGLMVRSAASLQKTTIGINPAGVLTVRVDLPMATYTPEKGRAFYEQLVGRVGAVPGVDSVSLMNCPPVSGGCNGTSILFGRSSNFTNADPLVGIHWVTPDYFTTVGIPLVKGRNFTDRDRIGQPKVVLVNEAAARAFWPNDTPIGKTVAVGQGGFHDGAEVIGIVANVRYRAIETAATPDVYVPLMQSYQSRMRLFVRSRLDVPSLVTAISGAVRGLDPTLPLSEVKTMDARLGDAMWRTRVGAWLLSGFAGLALLLTAIGIFGVMSQAVSQRTTEIGVRMALGAQARDVLSLMLGRAALVTLAGIILGIGSALALTRLIGALLYGVEANDPLTFVAVAFVLGLVALAACYLPARRATQVDAVVALRSE
jgi:putative ABC transport system permease protein